MARNAKIVAAMSAAMLTMGLFPLVRAQSGTRTSPQRAQPPATQPSAPRAEVPFEDRFWHYLQQAQYRHWAPLPGIPGEAYEGHSPHGEKVKLYANRTAAAGGNTFPSGSILVKENFDATGTKLMAVTVMYRSQGYSPESGDWYWTKYEADGSVATMDGMRIAGRVGMCIDCHRSAGGNDFVFANDR
jgi:hypothetical protein